MLETIEKERKNHTILKEAVMPAHRQFLKTHTIIYERIKYIFVIGVEIVQKIQGREYRAILKTCDDCVSITNLTFLHVHVCLQAGI